MLIASDQFRIVVGLGKSGMSLVRHLARRGLPFAVVDTRANPPELASLQAEYPHVQVRCGELDVDFLCTASELLVSPGLPVSTPALQAEAAKPGHRAVSRVRAPTWKFSAPTINDSAVKLDAATLERFGVVNEVIPEPFGGAHNDPGQAAKALRYVLHKHLNDLRNLDTDTLLQARYERFRNLGQYEETVKAQLETQPAATA